MNHGPLDYAPPRRSSLRSAGRFLLAPTGWPLAAAAAGLGVLTAAAAVPPGADIDLLMVAGVGWLAVAGVWVDGEIARRHGPPSGPAPRPWRWAVVPGIGVAAVLVAGIGLPGGVGFDLTHPGMRSAAEAALARLNATQPTCSVRGYGSVTPEVMHDGTVYFPVINGGFLSKVADKGYDYSPGGPPHEFHECQHIGGPWYWCVRTW